MEFKPAVYSRSELEFVGCCFRYGVAYKNAFCKPKTGSDYLLRYQISGHFAPSFEFNTFQFLYL